MRVKFLPLLAVFATVLSITLLSAIERCRAVFAIIVSAGRPMEILGSDIATLFCSMRVRFLAEVFGPVTDLLPGLKSHGEIAWGSQPAVPLCSALLSFCSCWSKDRLANQLARW